MGGIPTGSQLDPFGISQVRREPLHSTVGIPVGSRCSAPKGSAALLWRMPALPSTAWISLRSAHRGIHWVLTSHSECLRRSCWIPIASQLADLPGIHLGHAGSHRNLSQRCQLLPYLRDWAISWGWDPPAVGSAPPTAALSLQALPGARGWLRRLGEPLGLQPPEQEAVLRVLDAGLERCLALHAACIPLPGHRKLPGKAGIDEVMAAAVLTSLSSSPLGLGHPPAPPGPAELGSEIWKETPAMSFSCSSSSNTSGEWSWDPPSDRSTPSTPSPPLSSHDPSAFLPPDDGPEEPDSTHFMFGEPIPRKRKNSTKVMFKCLWKSCGKVLSSSSGMQKHIRTAHLGRQADLEQSDGEEDFYYTELDVDVDSLTDGLSSLTPVSPTSSVPPAFPGPELPPFPSPEPPLGSPRSPPPPPGLCHVHTDHAYQGCPSGPTAGEKRPPGLPLPGLRTPALPTPTLPKPPAVPRKPRGEAKKCRKVYGMENRELWCTACRWKKACQRFLD
ncbi:SLC2A4 regulator-like [Centrocercus urophasianus]|uniref:SLC2A4 regulator-like n=1 Tax=Centrocercus urophasianus TaxID=9002 RepID=UPI001C64656F|nr:SLC2A4 regulator-like [Centrocercus urophasianus]